MKTQLDYSQFNPQELNKADEILGKCVHCGFCLATCPTYQLTGSELDSPRGRIYLIKSLLEGNKTSKKTLHHLDRCLTCRACETTCPSGVEYGHLVGIGRSVAEKSRPKIDKFKRYIVRQVLTTPSLLQPFSKILAHSPISTNTIDNPLNSKGTVLLLSGCVQPNLTPNINAASEQVLKRLGFEVVSSPKGECCGAIDEHLSATKVALEKIKANLDHWCHWLDNGVDAIISTASGCGAMIKDYRYFFDKDSFEYQQAQKIKKATEDISEFMTRELMQLSVDELTQFCTNGKTISLHTPCTLQHAQKQPNIVADLLIKLGFEVVRPKDDHLCCGSAGTYSIFQPKLAKQLRQNKLINLEHQKYQVIATANIGCLLHLQKETKTPVKHWIELLAQ